MFKSPVLVGDSAIPPNREVSSHALRGDPVPASTTGSERRSRRWRNSELEEDLLRRIKMIFREGECRRWTAGNQAAGSQRSRQRRSFAPEYCYWANVILIALSVVAVVVVMVGLTMVDLAMMVVMVDLTMVAMVMVVVVMVMMVIFYLLPPPFTFQAL